MEVGPELEMWLKSKNSGFQFHPKSNDINAVGHCGHMITTNLEKIIPPSVIPLKSESDLNCPSKGELTHKQESPHLRIQSTVSLSAQTTASDEIRCKNEIQETTDAKTHIPIIQHPTASPNGSSLNAVQSPAYCETRCLPPVSQNMCSLDTCEKPSQPIPESGNVQCPECDRSFVNKRSMLIHSTKAHFRQKSKRISKVSSKGLVANCSMGQDTSLTTGLQTSGIFQEQAATRCSSKQLSPTCPQSNNLCQPSPNLSETLSDTCNSLKKTPAYTVSLSPLADGNLKLRLVSLESPDHQNTPVSPALISHTPEEPRFNVVTSETGLSSGMEPQFKRTLSIQGAWTLSKSPASALNESNEHVDNKSDSNETIVLMGSLGTPEQDAVNGKRKTPSDISDTKRNSCSVLKSLKKPNMDTRLRSPDGLYTCRLCKRMFQSRYALTGHYKSHYSANQKPYICDDCGQRYTSPSNLQHHRSHNCAVLKLRAIKANVMMPVSKRCMKLLQKKAIRATERKKLLRTTRCETNPHGLRITEPLHRSTGLKDKRSLPYEDETNDGQLNETDASEHSNDTILVMQSKTANQNPSNYALNTERHFEESHLMVGHETHVTYAESFVPACKLHSKRGTHVTELETVLSENTQFPLGDLLERLYQSDSGRRNILNFTSYAILSVLGLTDQAGGEQGSLMCDPVISNTHTKIGCEEDVQTVRGQLKVFANKILQDCIEYAHSGQATSAQSVNCRTPSGQRDHHGCMHCGVMGSRFVERPIGKSRFSHVNSNRFEQSQRQCTCSVVGTVGQSCHPTCDCIHAATGSVHLHCSLVPGSVFMHNKRAKLCANKTWSVPHGSSLTRPRLRGRRRALVSATTI